jgi:hypothetical protein
MIKTKDKISAVVCFLLVICFLVVAFTCAENTREFISKAKVTDGVVIATPHGGSHPDIIYTDASGKRRWLPANGWISGYKVGDHVRVLYNPADPLEQDIDDFGALYFWSLLCGFFGICYISMGILSLFGMRKSRSM